MNQSNISYMYVNFRSPGPVLVSRKCGCFGNCYIILFVDLIVISNTVYIMVQIVPYMDKFLFFMRSSTNIIYKHIYFSMCHFRI